jgi:UDP-N-acetylglucosamine 2-epimerase
MRILTIVGARPQFIKCAPVSAALRTRHDEVLVHTGQHYDAAMSRVFFEEMGIPAPDVNLGVGSGSHAVQTAAMLTGIEALIRAHTPAAVMVYGDTNSTLAGALAAAKLCVPIVHVEAGLRSFNRDMPEEINRVVADRLASVLCCPTQTAVDNLRREGICNGVALTGDVMYDALLHFRPLMNAATILTQLNLAPRSYAVLTVHRAANTDNAANLRAILEGIQASGRPCVFPVHPRTRGVLARHGIAAAAYPAIAFIEPLGYGDFMALTAQASVIVTDSGGLQKEAYWHGVPCVTVRDETEWVETVAAGWNRLVGTDSARIADAVRNFKPQGPRPDFYGDGKASGAIVDAIEALISTKEV